MVPKENVMGFMDERGVCKHWIDLEYLLCVTKERMTGSCRYFLIKMFSCRSSNFSMQNIETVIKAIMEVNLVGKGPFRNKAETS